MGQEEFGKNTTAEVLIFLKKNFQISCTVHNAENCYFFLRNTIEHEMFGKYFMPSLRTP